MNNPKIIPFLTILAFGFPVSFTLVSAQNLYTESAGSNPPFNQLMAEKGLKRPTEDCQGNTFDGTTIDVNNEVVETGPFGNRSIEDDIGLHQMCASQIPRKDFHKYKRWYQEDGNTQIFRLHKGDENIRNSRTGAARIETHSHKNYKRGDGVQTWEGRYTIIKPNTGGSMFQAFNGSNQWAVSLGMNMNGDIDINHRTSGQDKIIARNMIGKGFDIKVEDDGHNYRVWLNGAPVDGGGSYSRPSGTTSFRWGMYRGGGQQTVDAMIFVTGARVNFKPSTSANYLQPVGSGNSLRFLFHNQQITLPSSEHPVDLFNLQGDLVKRLYPENNYLVWDGTGTDNKPVASGLLLVRSGNTFHRLLLPGR